MEHAQPVAPVGITASSRWQHPDPSYLCLGRSPEGGEKALKLHLFLFMSVNLKAAPTLGASEMLSIRPDLQVRDAEAK